MLAKSIIAGTVLSLMAGGVVYFGTDVDASAVKEKVATKTAEMKAEVSDKVMAGGRKEHPHSDKTDRMKSETSVDMSSVKTASGKVIKAKEPTVSYSSGTKPSESEQKAKESTEMAASEKPEKKWLNQYLKKDAKKPLKRKINATEVVSPEPTAKEQMGGNAKILSKESYGSGDTPSQKDAAKALMESMGLNKEGSRESDTGSFVIEDEDEGETVWTEDTPSETGRKKATRKMLSEIIKKDGAVFMGEDAEGKKKVEVKVIANEEGETTIETETLDMGDGKIIKIVKKTVKSESHDKNGKKMRIKVMTDKDGISAEDIEIIRMGDDAHSNKRKKRMKKLTSDDISEIVTIVMDEAEKIEMPELRDRAYLDLVSFGLENGDYKVAAKALEKIEQVELRDTARNRIAVAYAKDGNAEDAFGILDDIEVDALRDIMRLQVIEAMIAPDALSKDMQ